MEEKKKETKLYLAVTLVLLPILVSVISMFIEHSFFTDKKSEDSQQTSQLSYEERSSTKEQPFVPDTTSHDSSTSANLTIRHSEASSQKNSISDDREIKVLTFEAHSKKYNWAVRLLGWFFSLLPLFFSLKAIFGGEAIGVRVVRLYGCIGFIAFWFVLSLVVLLFYLPMIYYLGIATEFDGLIYAVKIYEDWANGLVQSL